MISKYISKFSILDFSLYELRTLIANIFSSCFTVFSLFLRKNLPSFSKMCKKKKHKNGLNKENFLNKNLLYRIKISGVKSPQIYKHQMNHKRFKK